MSSGLCIFFNSALKGFKTSVVLIQKKLCFLRGYYHKMCKKIWTDNKIVNNKPHIYYHAKSISIDRNRKHNTAKPDKTNITAQFKGNTLHANRQDK